MARRPPARRAVGMHRLAEWSDCFLTGPNLNDSSEIVRLVDEPRPVGRWNSIADFALIGRAGQYALRAEVDPEDAYPETVETDNARASLNLSVRAPDLVGSLTGDAASHTTPSRAYAYEDGLTTVSFVSTVLNTGDHVARNVRARNEITGASGRPMHPHIAARRRPRPPRRP